MKKPVTESANPQTVAIDRLNSLEIVTMINQEDAQVAPAVQKELPQIARAVDLIVERLRAGGRLFYFGAGTSGRLAVLDAAELPPTYNVPPEQVQAFIAGGDAALRRPAEAAEDDADAGRLAAGAAGIGPQDVVVGVSASGGAPWVIGALEEARQRGAARIALVCNPQGALVSLAQVVIAPLVGPEVIAGSTRMKAGTAQKMILNLLSTAAMIRLGKVYGNLMIDLRASNQKLRERAAGILQEIAGVDAAQAVRILEQTGYEVKPALVMLLSGVDQAEARRRLAASGGLVREALSNPADGMPPGHQA